MRTDMSEIHNLPPPEPSYRAIEATLASHEPGRRFLAEHARRSRHAETAGLLDAIARLNARAAEATPPPDPAAPIAADFRALRDLAATTAESLAAAILGGSDPSIAGEPDVSGLEPDVPGLVELLQDTFWSMRESGQDARLCDLLDGLALQLGRASRRRDEAIARARDAASRLGDRIAEIERRSAESTAARGRRRRARRDPSEDVPS